MSDDQNVIGLSRNIALGKLQVHFRDKAGQFLAVFTIDIEPGSQFAAPARDEKFSIVQHLKVYTGVVHRVTHSLNITNQLAPQNITIEVIDAETQ